MLWFAKNIPYRQGYNFLYVSAIASEIGIILLINRLAHFESPFGSSGVTLLLTFVAITGILVFFIKLSENFKKIQYGWLKKYGTQIKTRYTRVKTSFHSHRANFLFYIQTEATYKGKNYVFNSNLVNVLSRPLYKIFFKTPGFQKEQIDKVVKDYIKKHGTIEVLINPQNPAVHYMDINWLNKVKSEEFTVELN